MFSGKPRNNEEMQAMINPPAREDHMIRVAKRQHENFGAIERKKRHDQMQAIAPTLKTISDAMLDYDESFIPPIVCFNFMVTINNLTMLHPDIAYTPTSISYNSDMTHFSMTYEDKESGEWVRIDIDGENYEMTLFTSNAIWPSNGYENVSIADVVGTIQYLITKGKAPANLAQPPVVPVAD